MSERLVFFLDFSPPSYWKMAILITVLNPPLGLLALFMCYLTGKDVDRGRLLEAKKRSKQTLIVVMVGFAVSILTLVSVIVVLTAENKFPFHLKPQVKQRKQSEPKYVPPPPPPRRRERPKRPPPPPPRPAPTYDDVLGKLVSQWEGVNISSYQFPDADRNSTSLRTGSHKLGDLWST